MKQVENYFKDYPGNKECFTTSDGMVFHNKYDAQMHSKSLKDDEVTQHKAAKQLKEEPKEPKQPKEAVKKEGEKATEKAK